MGAGEEEYAAAILALSKIETASAFVMAALDRRNTEAEHWREIFAESSRAVGIDVRGEHLGTRGRTGHDGLSEGYLKVGEAGLR